MRISTISNTLLYSKNKISSSKSYVPYNNVSNNTKPDIFVKSPSRQQGVNIIPFMGYKVFLVDGGNHATNLFHFAKAISKEMNPELYTVRTIPNYPNTKNLKDLEKILKQLPEGNYLLNQYFAVPASSSVSLLNLQDQVNRVMHTDVKLTPENIKAHKELVLSFLKKIYDNPLGYREYIGYMDTVNQGIEYTYGVISQINTLIKKYGARVYLPAENPQNVLDVIEKMKNTGKLDRILFGTDAPLGCYGEPETIKRTGITPKEAYELTISRLKSAIKNRFKDEADMITEKIFYENSKNLFFGQSTKAPNDIVKSGGKGKLGVVVGTAAGILAIIGGIIAYKNGEVKKGK